jgi:hypothetical protein
MRERVRESRIILDDGCIVEPLCFEVRFVKFCEEEMD